MDRPETLRVTPGDHRELPARLREDSAVLNAFALGRLLGMARGEARAWVCARGTGSTGGYLSVLESPQAVDVWVRGAPQEVATLLDFFVRTVWRQGRSRILYVNTDQQHVQVVTDMFPDSVPSLQDVMGVGRGQERLSSGVQAARLGPGDASEYARLSVPEGIKVTRGVLSRNRSFLKDHPAYGVREDGRLVSVANIVVMLPEVCVISGVATHGLYRGRGYATAVVSAVTREALAHAPLATLYVNQDNGAAIGIYSKLGYRKITESACVELD